MVEQDVASYSLAAVERVVASYSLVAVDSSSVLELLVFGLVGRVVAIHLPEAAILERAAEPVSASSTSAGFERKLPQSS